MPSEKLARRYAVAVFSLAKERNAVNAVGDDLATVASVFADNPLLKEFFTAPIVARGVKERALLAAFEGKVHEIALHTLLLLVRKRRETLLAGLLGEYRKLQLAAPRRGVADGRVRSNAVRRRTARVGRPVRAALRQEVRSDASRRAGPDRRRAHPDGRSPHRRQRRRPPRRARRERSSQATRQPPTMLG